MNQSCNFDVLLDLDSLEPYVPTLFEQERQKLKLLAVIDNYNFYDRHTDTQTDGHGNSMTDPAQRAKLVFQTIKEL